MFFPLRFFSIKRWHLSYLFYLFHAQFADELQNKGSPVFKQASTKPHALGCMDFVPTNFHLNMMQVSCPKSNTSAGRAFSIRFGRKNSFFGLDPDQGWCSFEELNYCLFFRFLHLFKKNGSIVVKFSLFFSRRRGDGWIGVVQSPLKSAMNYTWVNIVYNV